MIINPDNIYIFGTAKLFMDSINNGDRLSDINKEIGIGKVRTWEWQTDKSVLKVIRLSIETYKVI